MLQLRQEFESYKKFETPFGKDFANADFIATLTSDRQGFSSLLPTPLFPRTARLVSQSLVISMLCFCSSWEISTVFFFFVLEWIWCLGVL